MTHLRASDVERAPRLTNERDTTAPRRVVYPITITETRDHRGLDSDEMEAIARGEFVPVFSRVSWLD
jgi:hypothetical protein